MGSQKLQRNHLGPKARGESAAEEEPDARVTENPCALTRVLVSSPAQHVQLAAGHTQPLSPGGGGVVHPDAPGGRACIPGRPRLRVSRQTSCWRGSSRNQLRSADPQRGGRLLGCLCDVQALTLR